MLKQHIVICAPPFQPTRFHWFSPHWFHCTIIRHGQLPYFPNWTPDRRYSEIGGGLYEIYFQP